MIERFRFLQGDFAACGRRVTRREKVTKESPGDAADGHFVPQWDHFPPVPRCPGDTP